MATKLKIYEIQFWSSVWLNSSDVDAFHIGVLQTSSNRDRRNGVVEFPSVYSILIILNEIIFWFFKICR